MVARLAQQQGQTPVSKAAILYLARLHQPAVDTVAVETWLGQVSPVVMVVLVAAAVMVGLVGLGTHLLPHLRRATMVLQQAVLHIMAVVVGAVHLLRLPQLTQIAVQTAEQEPHLAFLARR